MENLQPPPPGRKPIPGKNAPLTVEENASTIYWT